MFIKSFIFLETLFWWLFPPLTVFIRSSAMSLWREGFYCRIVTEGLGETHKDVRDPVSSLNHVCGMVGWTSMTPTPSPSSPCLIALLWRQFCSPSTLPHRSLPVGATPGFASGSYLEICPYTAFHIPLPEILILISSGF